MMCHAVLTALCLFVADGPLPRLRTPAHLQGITAVRLHVTVGQAGQRFWQLHPDGELSRIVTEQLTELLDATHIVMTETSPTILEFYAPCQPVRFRGRLIGYVAHCQLAIWQPVTPAVLSGERFYAPVWQHGLMFSLDHLTAKDFHDPVRELVRVFLSEHEQANK